MKRVTKWIMCLLLAVALFAVLPACTGSKDDFEYGDIEKISVDESLNTDDFIGFSLDTFDISQITLYIKLKDKKDAQGNVVAEGETIERKAEWYMLKAEDKEKIKKAGTNTITLVYGKHEVSFRLKLYEGTMEYHTVAFYAEDGKTLLGSVQRVAEGYRAVQPEVPAKSGYTFIGWTDLETGKSVTFDNVTRDLSLRAVYEPNSATVGYYYKNGTEDVLIVEKQIERGDGGEFNYPDPPEREGYLFTNWRKDSAEKFYAEYEPVAYQVDFIYRKYADGKYTDSFVTETVSYLGGENEIVPPKDYKPDNLSGDSDADDYKFVYWYVKRGTEKRKIEFPVKADNTYELTYYAQYIDLSVGSEELRYKKSGDACMISGYVGDGGVVVIPEKHLIDGVLYDVTGIGDGVFKSVPVAEFLTTSTNPHFATKNGVLYSKDYTVLYAYPSASNATSYTVESATEELDPYSFYGAVNLKSVTLNDALVYIRDYAFRDCTALEKIEIPENVENIGEGAFRMSGKSKLTTITFEGTELTSIGDEAFYGLNALTELELPASLTSIGEGVFYGCGSLRRVDATKNAYFVEYNGALYDSEYRTLYVFPAKYTLGANPEVVLHENCRTVARGAFYYASINCVTLTSNVSLETYSIVCPALLYVRIASDAFYMREDLFLQAFAEYLPQKIWSAAGGYSIESIPTEHYSDWDGLSDYESDYAFTVRSVGGGSREATITAYRGSAASISVPVMIGGAPVVRIGSDAFNGNADIVSVELPDTVIHIDDNAFMNCENLTTVVINGYSVDGLNVGDKAFYGCSSLTEVDIASGATFSTFGKYVFEGTPIMEASQSFVIVGGVLVAYNGSSLSVEVPTTVSYVATDAFKDKGFITDIDFPTDSLLTTVDEYAFLNCTGLKELRFPSGIRTVNDRAFYGCDYLYKVYYAATQDRVAVSAEAYYQAGAYYGEGVHAEYLGGEMGEIDYHAKEQIMTETGLAFVEPVTPEITPSELFIGWYTDETYATRVVFPVSVQPGETLHVFAKIVDSGYVSDGLVYSRNEDGTYTITDYTGTDDHLIIGENYMGAKVVGIDRNAFGEIVVDVDIPNQLNLTTSQYVSNILTIGLDAFTKTLWYQNIAGDFVIYDNLLLGYKGDAKNVVIPDSVSVIAEGVFRDNKSVEVVTFPASVHTLPKDLFYGCTALKKVVLGTELTSIGERAFYNCTSLADVNFADLSALSSIAEDAMENTFWLANVSGDCIVINGILYKYFGSATTLHIPSSVEVISEGVFKDNANLVEVYFPAALTTIRSRAFEGAISLKSVFLPADSALAYIMDSSFKNCFNLSEFDFAAAKDLSEISDYAFESSTALSQLTISSNLVRLGSYSFKYSGVERVTAADDSRLTTIDEGAFYGCRSLKSFAFAGTNVLSSVGDYVFYECTALEKFLAGNASIESIGDYAFYNCRSLTQVTLNENALSSLGKDAVYRMGYITSKNTNLVLFGNILISYSGTDKIVTIPANVTLIYDSAFEGNTNILSIVFESDNHLTKINDRAFYGCTNLENITFPTSLDTVGYMVMDGTAWYTSRLQTEDYIVINSTLVKYNVGYPRQAEVPENVTKIIRGAFDGARVYDIKIGASVREIEEGAFDGIVPVVWKEEGKFYSGWTLTLMSQEPFTLEYERSLPACRAIYVQDELTKAKFLLNTDWLTQTNLIRVIDKYTIKYSVITGEADGIAPESVHALYNAKEVNAYRTTSKQYVFVGWFVDEEYSESVTYPFVLTEDTTIYAKCIDYDDGSNPEDYMLEETDDGRYTIVSYHDDTDKNVVVITEQADIPIYSITGYLGYVKYSGEEETQLTKYIYDEATGSYVEEITYVLVIVPYTYVEYDPDTHADAMTIYAHDESSDTYYPYEGVTYFYDETTFTYIRYTSARGNVQQYLLNEETEMYVEYEERTLYLLNEETRLYEPEPTKYVYEDEMFIEYDRTQHASAVTRYILSDDGSQYVPYEGTLFVYNGTLKQFEPYNAYRHSGMTQYLLNEVTGEYEDYTPRTKYIQLEDTATYVPEPTKYVLKRDLYDFRRYSRSEYPDAETQYIYDETAETYVPYKGKTYVYLQNEDRYEEYVSYRHGDAAQYLYDEYAEEYVLYSEPTTYVYDENEYVLKIYDEDTTSTTVRQYVYDNEERAFVIFDPYGTYPEGTDIYMRNSLIEEVSFANNCTIEVLGDNCFAGMTNLQKVTIPASVKRISVNAFSDCVNLREIVFAAGVSDLVIEEGAFRNCTNLQTVSIPVGVTTLSDGAFAGCSSLREVYLESETPIVLYNNAMPFEITDGLKIYIPFGRTANYSSNWSAYYEYLVELPQTTEED